MKSLNGMLFLMMRVFLLQWQLSSQCFVVVVVVVVVVFVIIIVLVFVIFLLHFEKWREFTVFISQCLLLVEWDAVEDRYLTSKVCQNIDLIWINMIV